MRHCFRVKISIIRPDPGQPETWLLVDLDPERVPGQVNEKTLFFVLLKQCCFGL